MKSEDYQTLKKVLGHLRMSHILNSTEGVTEVAPRGDALRMAASESPKRTKSNTSQSVNQDSPDSAENGDDISATLAAAPLESENAKYFGGVSNRAISSSWPGLGDSDDSPVFDIPRLSDPVDLIDSSGAADPFQTSFPAGFWPLSNFDNANFGMVPDSLPDEAGYIGAQTLEALAMSGTDGSADAANAAYGDGAEEDLQGDENTELLLDELSNRIGSLQIGPGGQVRYFGATSNFNLVDMPAPDNLTVHRTVRNDGQRHLECLGMGKDVPSSLEDHLTSLYFAWQDPTFHAVNRTMFESAKVTWREKQEDTPYYSEALQNAM